MTSTATKVIGGFIAGALAVLIFHQGMYVLMQQYGAPYGIKLGGSPWRFNAVPMWQELFGLMKMQPLSVPTIVRQSIWGGLYGILFAFLIGRIPGGLSVIKGFVFGMIFPMLLVGWLAIPALRGEPLLGGAFAKGGFNYLALRNGFLLNGLAFGVGLGIIYPLLTGMMKRR